MTIGVRINKIIYIFNLCMLARKSPLKITNIPMQKLHLAYLDWYFFICAALEITILFPPPPCQPQHHPSNKPSSLGGMIDQMMYHGPMSFN